MSNVVSDLFAGVNLEIVPERTSGVLAIVILFRHLNVISRPAAAVVGVDSDDNRGMRSVPLKLIADSWTIGGCKGTITAVRRWRRLQAERHSHVRHPARA